MDSLQYPCMPELPEVETTRRGVEPYSLGREVRQDVVRESRLRWPVPADLTRTLRGQRIEAVERRAKYLLFRTSAGTLLVHLGMSGSLRVIDPAQPPGKHDHIESCSRTGTACASMTHGVLAAFCGWSQTSSTPYWSPGA